MPSATARRATSSIDLVEEAGHRRNGAKRQHAVLRLTVSDDGKGIDPSTPKGFGLTTMTERVKSLGGSCAIESEPQRAPPYASRFRCNAEKGERARALELVGGMS